MCAGRNVLKNIMPAYVTSVENQATQGGKCFGDGLFKKKIKKEITC